MQIPTNFSAAQAVSIASVVSNRDKSSVQATSTPEATVQAQLEKSESASPDRDAQGQGDGLGQHSRKQQDENEVIAVGDAPNAISASSLESNEQPPQLDLVC